MAMDTVNGHELPVDGNINTLSGSAEISALVTANRIFAAAINTSGEVDATGVEGALAITDATAAALAVGANGSTNPVLKVNAATASVATGLEMVGAAAGGGVSINAISSGTNENIALNGKGSGTVKIANVSTGDILFGNGVTIQALTIDHNAATSATGLKVVSAAATSGLAASVLSTDDNENLTVDAKGTGTTTINGTATGNVVIGSALAFGTDAGGAKSIVIGTTNGLKVGTGTNQKIGFFNKAPIIQPTSASIGSISITGGTYGFLDEDERLSVMNKIQALSDICINLGLASIVA